ncbi:MAG: hypothetical protein H0W27_05860 [Actinobacteria bacterium]|nr:hypothetical protein [Actinomycetota bacterium]
MLLFDGVFLLRPELNDSWDFRIFVWVDEEEILRRAAERDVTRFGSREAVLTRYRRRYLPAQGIYADAVRPREKADVVIDNSDPARPTVYWRD